MSGAPNACGNDPEIDAMWSDVLEEIANLNPGTTYNANNFFAAYARGVACEKGGLSFSCP
jgi:hypothetical protein